MADSTYLTADARWQAVLGRDAAADGAFVFAVRSTGIYCRPACPARRPRREQVRFFDRPDEAEAAGFRACRRCRPQLAEAPLAAALRAACEQLAAADSPPGVAALAAAAGFSPSHFRREFKRLTGVTPRQYAAQLRLNRFNRELGGGASVTDAMLAAGFGSPSRLYAASPQHAALAPSRLRGRGAGERVRFALAASELGWFALAATERGVCLVEFGDSPDALRALVRARLDAAELIEDTAGLAAWTHALAASIRLPRAALDLPLDLRGTSFQCQVWQALRAIPTGATLSYGALAARLGRPQAARAVAAACAANRVAVLVPCHRIVAADGELAGYRWGVARKAALLRRESAVPDEAG